MPLLSPAIKRMSGVAGQRDLPRFAPNSFQQLWRREVIRRQRPPQSVLLWPDTWNNYYHPQSLMAAANVLDAAGFAADVPRNHICCGRPLYDFGFLDQARKYLLRILEQFAERIDAGQPVVFLEPSCASVFRNELLDFFPHNERAKKLSEQTLLLSEFLSQHADSFEPAGHAGERIVLHGHCHQKAVFGMEEEVKWLRRTGAQVDLLDAGCCGMAGPFGFEREKYDVSQAIGERVLLPAVRKAAPADLLVTDGFSCREQIAQSTARRAIHFAEAICPRRPDRQ